MSDYSDVEDDYADSPHSGQGAVADDPKRHARAQHNALERRRRDNIKDMYSSLRDTVPEMNNERASRAVILKRAIDAIEVRAAANEELEAKKRRHQEKVAQLEAEIKQIQEEMKNIEKKAELTEERPSLPPTPEMRFSAQQ